MSLRGARIGYSHTSYALVDGEIETRRHEEISVQRMGSTMKSVSDEVFRESLEGQPLSFRYEGRAGSHTLVNGTITGGKLRAEVRHGGKLSERSLDLDPEVRFPVALDRLARQHTLASGLKFSDKHLALASLTVSVVDYEVLGREDLQGQSCWKLRCVTRGTGGFEQILYVDESWETRRMDFVGLSMRAERCTEAQALAATGKSSEDILSSSGLPCDVLLLRPRRLSELAVRVRCKSGGLEGLDFAGEYQTAQPSSPDSVVVRVKPPALSGEATRDVEPEYLAANDYLHCADPKIVDTARRVVGGSTGSEAVRKLRNWVATRVVAGGEVAFATDLEALGSGRGDCTERAVLLASLCRALGIPAKLVYGFAYSHGLFIGHCWNEVRLDGRWIPVDAALLLDDKDTAIDAAHLKMAETSLKDGNPDSRVMLGAFGRLETELVELAANGARVEGPSLRTQFEGRDWRFPGLGLGLGLSAGWSLRPASNNADLVLTGPQGALVSLTSMEKGRDYAQTDSRIFSRGELVRVAGLPARQLSRNGRLLLALDRGDTALIASGQNLTPKTEKEVLRMLNAARFWNP